MDLREKLQKFSDENGGLSIDWQSSLAKWYIYCDYNSKQLKINRRWNCRPMGEVHFASRQVAEKALDKFYHELREYYMKS